jgi:molybdopterin/thiamine biosynthesis adenylyltransferase/rhodanese-related sulfurtransferase
MVTELTPAEIQRYSRHLMIPEVGMEGQRKLKQSSVLIVGTGGLGSPVALYLAAAGIGRIGLVDYDVVDSSNLQRQVIHGSANINQLKVESARQRMVDLNPYIQVDIYNQVFDSTNAEEISSGYDLLVDGTDNFPTRYLVNDLAVISSKPYIYGSIFRFEGQVSVFDAQHGPCYRCLFPDPPPPYLVPSCSQAGVFGVLPGTIGTLQATEVLKIILGIGETLVGKLLLYDALDSSLQTIRLRKNPNCKVCGPNPQITHLIDYDAYCGVPTRDRPENHHTIYDLEPAQVARKIEQGESIKLLDVREPVELQISQISGAINIPVGELAQRLDELDPDQEYVLFCRTGVRSERALGILRSAGYAKSSNLRGGINAWARSIDTRLPEY